MLYTILTLKVFGCQNYLNCKNFTILFHSVEDFILTCREAPWGASHKGLESQIRKFTDAISYLCDFILKIVLSEGSEKATWGFIIMLWFFLVNSAATLELCEGMKFSVKNLGKTTDALRWNIFAKAFNFPSLCRLRIVNHALNLLIIIMLWF